jgi:hypothetical protein
MKFFFTAFLAILLAFNSLGLLIFYWGEIQLCKMDADNFAERNHDVSKMSLIQFSSSNNNFELINKSEILFGGKLFDIVKTEINNGKIIYYAIGDEKEDGCMNNIVQLSKNNCDSNSQPIKNNVPDILKYVRGENVITLSVSINFIEKKTSQQSLFFYSAPFQNIFSPPPNIFLS